MPLNERQEQIIKKPHNHAKIDAEALTGEFADTSQTARLIPNRCFNP